MGLLRLASILARWWRGRFVHNHVAAEKRSGRTVAWAEIGSSYEHGIIRTKTTRVVLPDFDRGADPSHASVAGDPQESRRGFAADGSQLEGVVFRTRTAKHPARATVAGRAAAGLVWLSQRAAADAGNSVQLCAAMVLRYTIRPQSEDSVTEPVSGF